MTTTAVPAGTTIADTGSERRRRVEFVALALVALAIPLAWWIGWTLLVAGHGFNDYHDFWLAARLILEGKSPYDIDALRQLANQENLHFVVGTGYSYPLPFAIAMIPLSLLPFTVSVLLFNAIGLALFAVTAASWIDWAHGGTRSTPRRRLVLAAAAGIYPPVYGTLANGQANLVLLPLMAFGVATAVAGTRPGRQFAGGVASGLAAIVKLTPGLFIVPLLIGRRWFAAAGVLAGAIGSLVVATAIAPWAGEGSGGLSVLFEKDSYFTNQSINGFVSRFVDKSDRTVPALGQNAFNPTPVAFVLTGALALLTLAVLWRSRHALDARRGLALGLGFALVAGLIGAPKGTYWNHSLSLIAVGLLVAVEAPALDLVRRGRSLRLGSLDTMDLLLLALWFGGTVVQTLLWMHSPGKGGSLGALVALLQSSATYGMFALWCLFARRLAKAERATATGAEAGAEAGPETGPDGAGKKPAAKATLEPDTLG